MPRIPSSIELSQISASQLTDSSGNTVERQVVTLGDAATEANVANITAAGALQIDGSAVTQPTNLQPQAAVLTGAVINFSASGNNTLVAGVAGRTTKVYRLMLTVAGATTLAFQDGTTALTGPMTLYPGGSVVLDYSSEPWFTGSANTAFNLNSSSAVQVSGRIWYINS